MPTGNQRIDHALTLIEVVAGEDERQYVEGRLNPATRTQFGDDLHIGGFRGGIGLLKSDKETFRRNLVRAILLTQLTMGKLQSPQVDARCTALMGLDTGRLEKELRSLFPFKPFRGRFAKRAAWDPNTFTNPWTHKDTSYMYLVHGIMGVASKVSEVMTAGAQASEIEAFDNLRMKYLSYSTIDSKNPMKSRLMVKFFEEYLDNPNILRQNIVSSSVISEARHATYYPFGFIMRVPPECIYITSPSDVGVSNRTNNILFELDDKQKLAQSMIRTPQEILAATTGANNDTGYNEIVIVGTSPEGKQVDVIGIYVKTDGRGNIFMRNGALSKDVGEPYVNKEIQKLISQSAQKFKLPIVPIADTSSGASTTAWPFGSLKTGTDVQMPGRSRSYSA